ncbi:MAG TPA: hypothetical protein VJJ27_01125 [Candidatus Paceibacterota bacterium]
MTSVIPDILCSLQGYYPGISCADCTIIPENANANAAPFVDWGSLTPDGERHNFCPRCDEERKADRAAGREPRELGYRKVVLPDLFEQAELLCRETVAQNLADDSKRHVRQLLDRLRRAESYRAIHRGENAEVAANAYRTLRSLVNSAMEIFGCQTKEELEELVK